MKRALPTEKVAQASKLFEKFHAAEELEDILDYHTELCNVLQIVPGNLKSFYNVIKVRTFFCTRTCAGVRMCEIITDFSTQCFRRHFYTQSQTNYRTRTCAHTLKVCAQDTANNCKV